MYLGHFREVVMRRHTRAGATAVVVAFAVGALCAGCGGEDRSVSLEMRFVELTAADSLTEMTMKIWGGQRTYYAHGEILLTERDVAAAAVVKRDGKPAIELVLMDEGRQKLLDLTRENVGRTLGVIVDGRLQCASVIQTPVGTGVVLVTGYMLEHGAQRFSRALNRQDA